MIFKWLLVLLLVLVAGACRYRPASASEAEKVFRLCRSIDLAARHDGIQGSDLITGKWSVKYKSAIIYINKNITEQELTKMRRVVNEEVRKVNFAVRIE